jgi:hypothetical protein
LVLFGIKHQNLGSFLENKVNIKSELLEIKVNLSVFVIFSEKNRKDSTDF